MPFPLGSAPFDLEVFMFVSFLEFYSDFIKLYFSTELAIDIVVCLLVVFAIRLIWSFIRAEKF